MNRLLIELQCLTGVMTEDLDYMLYLLLKDGSFFKEREPGFIPEVKQEVVSLEDWFSDMEEI